MCILTCVEGKAAGRSDRRHYSLINQQFLLRTATNKATLLQKIYKSFVTLSCLFFETWKNLKWILLLHTRGQVKSLIKHMWLIQSHFYSFMHSCTYHDLKAFFQRYRDPDPENWWKHSEIQFLLAHLRTHSALIWFVSESSKLVEHRVPVWRDIYILAAEVEFQLSGIWGLMVILFLFIAKHLFKYVQLLRVSQFIS